MKNAVAAFVLRFKVLGYTLLFRLQHLLVRIARTLPGCWKVFGIPRREIPDVEKWVAETRRAGQKFGPDGRVPQYASFGGPTRVPRRNTPPPGVDGVHPDLRQQNLEFRPPFLATLPSARLLGSEGSVITPDGGILTQSTWSKGLFDQDPIFRALRLPATQFLPGSYYTIASPFSFNYYHWMAEILPRLFAFDSVARDRPRLIVSAPMKSWQVESLELIGFRKEDWLALDRRYLHLETLYFPSHIGINPLTLDWLRQAIARSITVKPPSQRVYITRRRAARRRLVNEIEIESILQQHGFVVVELEALSFAEQVLLFGQSEMIIGIHGAGLTNMIFAPEGCKVMEIVDPLHLGVMYYMLAETLRHRYWPCVGQGVGDASIQHAGAHGHGDLTVSIDLFESTLLEMLDSKPPAS